MLMRVSSPPTSASRSTEMTEPRTIPGALDTLHRRFDVDPMPPGGAPVFLLASAWRSGSTLLQRLLVSSGQLLVWGEPFDHSAPVRRLAESVLPFDDTWPPAPYIVDPADPPTPDRWIANAYPHPAALIRAHRAFFDELFAAPAREVGFDRWGLKGVRLGGEHAVYLRRLYPDAQFIFLHRNPYDAYLSYRLLHDVRRHSYWWYHRWPDDQVATPTRFGDVWCDLTGSFVEWAPTLGAVVMAYEDLVGGRGLDRVAKLTGIDIDAAVLDQRVGATGDQRGEWEDVRTTLDESEIAAIRTATGGVGRRLGYVGPTSTDPN